MTEPPPLPRQLLKFKIACLIGVIVGLLIFALGAVLIGVDFIHPIPGGQSAILDMLTAGGLVQAALAVLVWKGHQWAFFPFLAFTGCYAFLIFTLPVFWFLGLINLTPLALLILLASPKHSRPAPPTIPEPAKTLRQKHEDIY